MNKDEEIRFNVIKELKQERKISNPDRIEVTVKNGVVTLKGNVEHYLDLVAALQATKLVPGIKGLAQDIHVNLPAAASETILKL